MRVADMVSSGGDLMHLLARHRQQGNAEETRVGTVHNAK